MAEGGWPGLRGRMSKVVSPTVRSIVQCMRHGGQREATRLILHKTENKSLQNK